MHRTLPLWHNYCWKVVNWYNYWLGGPILWNFLHSTLSLGTTTGKTIPFLAHNWCSNPTLSGTLLEYPTLCGTEVGQNGTLAILAYVYCHQFAKSEILFFRHASIIGGAPTILPIMIMITMRLEKLRIENGQFVVLSAVCLCLIQHLMLGHNISDKMIHITASEVALEFLSSLEILRFFRICFLFPIIFCHATALDIPDHILDF